MLIVDLGTTVEILSVPLAFPFTATAVTFAFKSSFDTEAPWLTTISVPVTLYSSLNLRTFTVTFTVSFDPSGYVTVTTPAFSPGPVVVLGVVAHVYVVSAGNPFLLILVPASGVAP